MRLFVACLASETNTFSPFPTTMAGFEELGIRRGGDVCCDPGAVSLMLDAIHATSKTHGCEVIEGLCAVAPPGGRVLDSTYEALREELLADLRAALPVDAAIFILHGAMAAQSYDDCEGDLLVRARAILGPAISIGVELDLHCHFTEKMRANADIAIAFKHYPHTDTADRARELTQLVLDAARGRIHPVMEVYDCRMVGIWPTTSEPVRAFLHRMVAAEGHDGVLSVSFAHGFPWGDVPEAGAKVWVVTDNDRAKADELARALGRDLWSIREAAAWNGLSVEAALTKAAQAASGPVVLADAGDNPGGGASGDSTFLLRAMLERGVRPAAFGCLFDPGAVRTAMAAGVGARVELTMGGKSGPQSGPPLNVSAHVLALSEEHGQAVFGVKQSLGAAARIEVEGVEVVLVSKRHQVVGADAFTDLGVDLARMRVVCVKSAHHFLTAFAPLASEVIYVAGPGALSHDFARLKYENRDLRYWPRVADPWGGS
jgi:microcystin degradation protein MlrC